MPDQIWMSLVKAVRSEQGLEGDEFATAFPGITMVRRREQLKGPTHVSETVRQSVMVGIE